MAAYTVDISQNAERDLAYYRAYERKIILDSALDLLEHNAAIETINRKYLRATSRAPWEAKVGYYRIFYAIEPDESLVIIVSIGHKIHNTLYIRGKVVQL